MKLNYITLMIRDIEKSIAFYQDLAGLHVKKRFNPGMGEIAFLANEEGETMLELIQFDNALKVETQGLVMSFLAGGELQKVRMRATELGYHPTEIIAEGAKPAHFTVPDPDGIIVEFSV